MTSLHGARDGAPIKVPVAGGFVVVMACATCLERRRATLARLGLLAAA